MWILEAFDTERGKLFKQTQNYQAALFGFLGWILGIDSDVP